MAGSDRKPAGDRNPPHPVKKCPECFAYVPLDADRCHDCGARLREVDWLGFARRPIDWRGYLIAFLFAALYGVFLWWAFFRD